MSDAKSLVTSTIILTMTRIVCTLQLNIIRGAVQQVSCPAEVAHYACIAPASIPLFHAEHADYAPSVVCTNHQSITNL